MLSSGSDQWCFACPVDTVCSKDSIECCSTNFVCPREGLNSGDQMSWCKPVITRGRTKRKNAVASVQNNMCMISSCPKNSVCTVCPANSTYIACDQEDSNKTFFDMAKFKCSRKTMVDQCICNPGYFTADKKTCEPGTSFGSPWAMARMAGHNDNPAWDNVITILALSPIIITMLKNSFEGSESQQLVSSCLIDQTKNILQGAIGMINDMIKNADHQMIPDILKILVKLANLSFNTLDAPPKKAAIVNLAHPENVQVVDDVAILNAIKSNMSIMMAPLQDVPADGYMMLGSASKNSAQALQDVTYQISRVPVFLNHFFEHCKPSRLQKGIVLTLLGSDLMKKVMAILTKLAAQDKDPSKSTVWFNEAATAFKKVLEAK